MVSPELMEAVQKARQSSRVLRTAPAAHDRGQMYGVSTPPYASMNDCSAVTAGMFRCEARGAAIACGSDMRRSRRSKRTCVTVVMIVDPPGDPTARNGRPWRSTIVGEIDERGRLPGSIRLGSAGS